ncbi:hypothetical protein NEOLEDRAFT_842017 [Neolentinus lepideus HHB14362 ss-1]|uniref:Uncharacterized protein n=1 Tax=Neolentinus lepideus HHB14362 ss-1 TaxID=1314782 RepID=A0A165P4K4_9AGAM|nr:hypothetical protein NEOLEDRAFT_842017 [Neolentinus lepideus HHB14362 ss-1]
MAILGYLRICGYHCANRLLAGKHIPGSCNYASDSMVLNLITTDSCDDRNLSPLQLQYKIKLPWSISHGVETRLHADTAHRLRSLQGVSSPVCDELESTDFRLMGRFMHEWNATCTPWSTETHVLGFPTAIPLSELRLLCYRLVDIDIHSEEISDVVNTITQKDRDACDMILDILRNRLLAYEGDEHKQLSYRYDLFSFVFKLRWIVKITLHGMVQIFDRYRPYPTSLPKAINGSVLWRQPGPRRGEYIISRNYMHDRYRERLIGDWRSLRWVPSTELPRRSNCYSPIIGSLDEAQRPQYIACIGTRDHHDPSAKLFLVGDDLQLQKSDASEWTDLMAANKNPCLYVLASRLLSTEQGKERSAIPHIYWASPEWGYVLCTCCNVGCRDSNDVFGNWHSDTRKIHIPEAILDVKLINAVSLEETVVKGGDNREIYIATWCDGGPRLSWKRNSWNVLPAEVEDDMIIVQHPLLTRELLTDADMISDVVDGERGLFAMKGNEQLEEGRLSEEYQRNSVKDGWTMSMRRPEWPKSRESIRLL